VTMKAWPLRARPAANLKQSQSAGLLGHPNAGRRSRPKAGRLGRPNAGQLSRTIVGRLSCPCASRLSSTSAGRLSHPSAGLLSRPSAGLLSRPSAGRLIVQSAGQLSHQAQPFKCWATAGWLSRNATKPRKPKQPLLGSPSTEAKVPFPNAGNVPSLLCHERLNEASLSRLHWPRLASFICLQSKESSDVPVIAVMPPLAGAGLKSITMFSV
jgi:hypothetical protein